MPQAAAGAFVAAFLAFPCAAKLSSTKAQESAMVSLAAPIVEKWGRYLNDTYGKNNRFTEEIVRTTNQIGSYENGIFNDMAVLSELAQFCVYAQRKDAKLFSAMDDFDGAADLLGAQDRRRYYAAKAEIRAELIAPAIAIVQREWLIGLGGDCCRASRFGLDAEKSITLLRRFAGRNSGNETGVAEQVCRIRLEYAHFFLAEARSFHLQNRYKEAFGIAMRGIREIPALSRFDSASCYKWRSDEALIDAYDVSFVQPLASTVGPYKDDLAIEVCRRYWKQRKLVSLVLPRIGTPSSAAFALFRKAGEDKLLKVDTGIAATELLLWRKARKTEEFKKKYPERYRFAKRAAAL